MNNDNGSKIITLDQIAKPNRHDRRHPEGMVRQLAQDKKALLQTVASQNGTIAAMNKLLTKIAETIGTPIPQGDANDAECIKQLLARLSALVETEREYQQRSMERSE